MHIIIKKYTLYFALVTSLYSNENSQIERMASMYIPFALKVCELQDTEEKKIHVAYVLAESIFTYYLHQEQEKCIRSKSIDQMIVAMYLDAQDKDVEISSLLLRAINNPFRLTNDKGFLQKHAKLGIENLNDYNKKVKDFKNYIENMVIARGNK